jgi:hypothetical protein
MESVWHIIITLIAIPTVLFGGQWFVKKADMVKQKEEDEWRGYVRGAFSNITGKITSICSDNKIDHEELFDCKNELFTRVGKIETIHHMKGCDERIGK